MCGICGIVSANESRLATVERLERMCATLVHRGPDDAGVMSHGPAGLGHRRLSILDLSAHGHQPMDSASGRFCVTYNGEIYNYRGLRDELRKLGHRFRSESDTEVLVEGVEQWGIEELLSRLDGIFAFAVWDRLRKKLFAARDHVGVKPFFYTLNSEEFVFGSEIRALWASGIPCEFDTSTLEELLVFRYVAGRQTPFRNIQRLLPGHYLEYSDGTLKERSYWNAFDHVDSDPEAIRAWPRLFARAVQDQQISDVPLGTLLSGGIDSSAITAELARRTSGQVQTFTASVPSSEGVDEWPFANAVAKKWNCQSHRLCLAGDEILDRLRNAQSFHDEPLAFGNDTHIFELSRLAKRHVTVLLSGEGADETLGGYTRYEPVRHPTSVRIAASGIGMPLRWALLLSSNVKMQRLGRLLSQGSLHNVMLYNSARLLPSDLEQIGFRTKQQFTVRRTILEEAARAVPQSVRQLMLYDMQTFLCSILDRNDRMTMAHSIECRVPFLAVRVVEAALRLPTNALFNGRVGKLIVRKHASDLLPSEVLHRPKWGLGVPWEYYFRSDPACRNFVTRLPDSEIARVLDAPGLRSAVSDFLAGDDQKAPIVYEFFSLTVWWQQIVEPAVARTPVLVRSSATQHDCLGR